MLKFDKVNLSYAPGAPPVLRDISLEIERGESVAIMGGNGSGKTTLALLAAGLLQPSSGRVELDFGSDARPGLVLQNPDNQIVSISIERELAFPLECRQMPTGKIRHQVDEYLNWTGFHERRQTAPSELSGGEKQKLALASALISGPGILILDEPSSHLDATGRVLLDDAIAGARKANQSLITFTVTQSSDEALSYSRLIVLHEGAVVADGKPKDIFANSENCHNWHIAIPDEYLLESLDVNALSKNSALAAADPESIPLVDDLIAVNDLSFIWENGSPVLGGLNFNVSSSRIVGIAARSGGGKTTLAYILSGLTAPTEGTIDWKGNRVAPNDLLTRVSCLFQFPERQFFCSTVGEEMAFGLRQMNLSNEGVERRIREALDLVGLDTDGFADSSPYHLSGGEMRKVAIATMIALKRQLIIYDEPTAELDSAAIEQFRNTVNRIRTENATQIIVSHDTDFLFSVCDDLILLKDGSIAYSGDKYGLSESPEIFITCGIRPPRLIEWSVKAGMNEYIRAERIGSVLQLAECLKLTS